MLKLAALDEEDLAIIGLHLYQARVNPAEIIWQAEVKRFLAPLCRFDWELALAETVAAMEPHLQAEFAKICAAEGAPLPAQGGAKAAAASGATGTDAAAEQPQEIAAILHFDAVRAVRSCGIDRHNKQQRLTLRELNFRSGLTPPAGIIELIFDDNAALQLEVDCIETRLTDMAE